MIISRLYNLISILILLLFSNSLAAYSGKISIELGSASTQFNYLQIPRDTGTKVDLPTKTDFPYLRLEGFYSLYAKHNLRFLLAPFSSSYEIAPSANVLFNQTNFAPGTLKVNYKFNSYRLGYVYDWLIQDSYQIQIGFTAKIRDAYIELLQNGLQSKKSNVGFVPLLYLAATYNFYDNFNLNFEMDALAGGPGYAVDASLTTSYHVNDRIPIYIGYRSLSGGADTKDVKNFAAFNFFFLRVAYEI